ncbi:MAG: alanine--tRNA ligase, partial [Deltaproteobacteria bacterium CG11_big_fil_rev_8_21_14_0_20_49_13]
VVIDEMGGAYPELIQHRVFIEKVISHEEDRFCETLDKGLSMLDETFEALKKKKSAIVPGEVAFKLYDTYGFPKDLTVDIASEHGMTIDEKGFENKMNAQREKARAAWKGSGEEKVEGVYKELKSKGIASKFVGYEKESCEAKVLAVIPSGKNVKFVTDVTPFYGESGGQVGDAGVAVADGIGITVTNATKPLPDIIVHEGVIESGELKEGAKITLAVDSDRRADTKRNHTATHLLHKTLRETLGEHVKQAGSLVGPSRLRFDFSHFHAMTDEEISNVEADVNDAIRKNFKVNVNEMPHEEAIKKGALAFFGEKYGARVRLVEVEGFSMELCGGTHVSRSGDIGMFKILSESSVASGVRRIEAVTGAGVEAYVNDMEKGLKDIASELKIGVHEVPARVKRLNEKVRQFEKQIEKGSLNAKADIKIEEVGGVKLIMAKVECGSVPALRELADHHKQKIGSGVIILTSIINDKVSLIVTVTKDLTGAFSAGDIVKKLSAVIGGTGGGRPDMAQGGGGDVSKIDDMLLDARKIFL